MGKTHKEVTFDELRALRDQLSLLVDESLTCILSPILGEGWSDRLADRLRDIARQLDSLEDEDPY